MVDSGAVLYGMITLILERGVRIAFRGLYEGRRWREKWQAKIVVSPRF
jgi:hypothetical protein